MATKNKIIEANIVLPKTQKKVVWAGLYGGHYSCIVFFKSKPVKSLGDRAGNIEYYDLYDNKAIIAGAMWLEAFEILYPNVNVGKPEWINILNVFQIKLEGTFDKDGCLSKGVFEYHADGY
jgi:hypothetical protein